MKYTSHPAEPNLWNLKIHEISAGHGARVKNLETHPNFLASSDLEHVNFKDEVQRRLCETLSCWSPNPTVKVKFHHEFCVDVEIVLRWNLACSLAKARLFSLNKPIVSPGAWRAVNFFQQFSALKKTLQKKWDMFQRSEYDDNLKTPDIHFVKSRFRSWFPYPKEGKVNHPDK